MESPGTDPPESDLRANAVQWRTHSYSANGSELAVTHMQSEPTFPTLCKGKLKVHPGSKCQTDCTTNRGNNRRTAS